jgi:hypothetical protein
MPRKIKTAPRIIAMVSSKICQPLSIF